MTVVDFLMVQLFKNLFLFPDHFFPLPCKFHKNMV